MLLKIKKYILILFSAVAVLVCPVISSADENYKEYNIELEREGLHLVSDVIFEDKSFNSVSIQAEKDINGLMVNFGNGWEDIKLNNDDFGFESILFTRPTRMLQFKKKSGLLNGKGIKIKANVFYYNPELFLYESEKTGLQSSSGNLVASNINVINRSQWGADENLRYWDPDWGTGKNKNGSTEKTSVNPCKDIEGTFSSELGIINVKEKSSGGDILKWPIQYVKKINKIVIHHTDSEVRDMNGDRKTDNRDYKAMIRAIYYYHAISRGWGDIGYNYIIDPLGNIYEGRYGGNKVIGAHTLCYNNGSLGIAVIGDYDDDDIPEPALKSLITLVARESKQFGIDPKGTSVFRGKNLPNVIGHKDVRNTSCPGQKLYSLLASIRDKASLIIRSGAFKEGGLEIQNLDYNAVLINDPPSVSLMPNGREIVRLKFKNTGKKTWNENTWLHVALNNNPRARIIPVIDDKAFVASDLEETSVAPGKTGTFAVEVEGGYFEGDYYFAVAPVVNGRYKISRSAVSVHINVEHPDFSYSVVKSDLPNGTVFNGQKISASIDLKNTGNIIWKNYGDNQITLGTAGPRDRNSVFIKNNPSRIGYLLQSEVAPGETGTFVMNLDVPTNKRGVAVEQFIPVIENITWLRDSALGFKVFLKEPVHLARIKKLNTVNNLKPGEMAKIELEIENRGDLAWDSENMKITLLGRGIKVFKSKLSPTETVNPGKKTKLSFWVQAPYNEGRHSIFLRGKFNKTLIRGAVARYVINVPKPSLRARFVSQTNRNINLQPGQEKELTVQFKNLSNVIWQNDGPNAVHLGTSLPNDRLSRLYYKKGWESKYRAAEMEEDSVAPGETGTFVFKIKPSYKGVYNENFKLVAENVGWIDGGNVKWTFRVFGKRVSTLKTNINNNNADLNKKRASVITKSLPKTDKNSSSTTTVKTNKAELPVSESNEEMFRVRLSYGDRNSVITANKNFSVTDKDGKKLFLIAAKNEVSVKKIGSNIHVQAGNTVKNSSIVRFVPDTGGIMEILSMENRPAWNEKLNDNRFRGVIEVRGINNEAAFINELPLEDYLNGLGEVSNDSHYEKQKVIAVLARSYAQFYMSDDNRKFPGLPYDGSDDPDIFQKYLGYGMEIRSPNFTKAVSATKDKVVTYNGVLVKTPYFNQSAGKTLSAEDVWGWTHTPYLKSVPDPWCDGLTKKGHGVGLSGYGATKQVEEGKEYVDIIKYYYKGVEVEEL